MVTLAYDAYRDGDRDSAIESARGHLVGVAAELEARADLGGLTDRITVALLLDAKRTERSLRDAVAALAGHASGALIGRIVEAIARIDAVESALMGARGPGDY